MNKWIARFVDKKLMCFEAEFADANSPGFYIASNVQKDGVIEKIGGVNLFAKCDLGDTKEEVLKNLYSKLATRHIVKVSELRNLEKMKSQVADLYLKGE